VKWFIGAALIFASVGCKLGFPETPDAETYEVEQYQILYYSLIWSEDFRHKGWVIYEAGIVKNVDVVNIRVVPVLFLYRDERHQFLISDYEGVVYDTLDRHPLTGDFIFGNIVDYLRPTEEGRSFIVSSVMSYTVEDVWPLMRFFCFGVEGESVLEFPLGHYKQFNGTLIKVN